MSVYLLEEYPADVLLQWFAASYGGDVARFQEEAPERYAEVNEKRLDFFRENYRIALAAQDEYVREQFLDNGIQWASDSLDAIERGEENPNLFEVPELMDEAELQLDDVHSKDAKTREAIELLRDHQGEFDPNQIHQAVEEFRQFLLAKPEGVKRERALHALEGESKPQDDFPALIGPHQGEDVWSIHGLVLRGEEVIGRLWIYANQLDGADRENAKLGMFDALADSFEMGGRVCNEGKTTRLAIPVLQGNLERVQIDEPVQEDAPVVVTPQLALIAFFQNPAHQQIIERPLLVAKSAMWLALNANIQDHAGFYQKLHEYGDVQAMDPIESREALQQATDQVRGDLPEGNRDAFDQIIQPQIDALPA